MSGRRFAAAPAIAATAAVLVTGCGTSDSADAPRSSDAKAALVKADAAVQKALSQPSLGQPTSSWEPVIDAVSDRTCDTGTDDKDGFRWRSVITLSIADRGTDGDGIASAVLGSLLRENLDAVSSAPTYIGDLDDDPILLLPMTHRSGEDIVSIDLTVQRAAQGWTFVVTGRTACLAPA